MLEAQYPAAEREGRAAVKMVDCDVHPVPSAENADLRSKHTPEPYRTQFYGQGSAFRTARPGLYDPPDLANAGGMRYDAKPPGGGPPGSDQSFAFEQLMIGAGVDVGLLGPLIRMEISPEASLARRMGVNGWLAEGWLDAGNDHGRWKGAICATMREPVGSAREIEKWAEHPHMVQVLVYPELRFGFGDPCCDPVYEAATRHDLPVSTHIARGPGEFIPLPPVGWASHWLDRMAPMSLLYATHLTSLIFDGAFERFPTLRIVFVEGSFTWILPLMWRMDRFWEMRRRDLPLVRRRPSEYVYEHVRLTTQPMEDPDDRGAMMRYLRWMDADRLLLFSTDYPHWSYDSPAWARKHMPKNHVDKIMLHNALELYSLPASLPLKDPTHG